MRRVGWLAIGLSIFLVGCGSSNSSWIQQISSVTPSTSGTPNSVVSLGNYEFVSVQGIGQIFTYNIATGSQVPVGKPYTTPCMDPSGMAIASVAGSNVMAVVCYDAGTLLTLTINADGSLTALGSVGGLPMPFPGIALDGTNVLVPLFGSSSSNGSVAKISIATPASPVVQGTAALASPVSGAVVNAGYLAVSGGYIYVTAGSESAPLESTSTIQVINEATMTLVGQPLVVLHSPQQIAIQGNVAYVTLYDALQLDAIDLSNPASLKSLGTLSFVTSTQNCHPLPVIVRGTEAYVGCYQEGIIDQVDITLPSQMRVTQSIPGVNLPQRLAFAGNSMLVTSSSGGGSVYQIDFSSL